MISGSQVTPYRLFPSPPAITPAVRLRFVMESSYMDAVALLFKPPAINPSLQAGVCDDR